MTDHAPNDDGPLWIFGYGSLIWHAGFAFAERRPASITGWTRRFWQGSHDHRGTPDAPGRVVTLVREAGARCAGVAFRVEPDVFAYLDHREKNGYTRHAVSLDFDDGVPRKGTRGVTYIAAPGNPAELGPAPLDEMAGLIARSHGPSGANRDYLFALAEALRELGTEDAHVFALEHAVRSLDADA